MKHRAAPDFWEDYRRLPSEVQRTADRAFELLKADAHHPSIHLKRIYEYWSARVGLHHRALAVRISDGLLWFWIGTHAEYDDIVGYSLLPPLSDGGNELVEAPPLYTKDLPLPASVHKG